MSEVVDLLQRLIRLDTTNPPGNETLAAVLLRDYLEAAGVECELYARVPERANLVARLRGGDGPTLALLSHTDVVLADAAEWERDPFGGELVDGEVWGRGALDMKGQVAASAVALASLAREGFRPRGDVVFVAAADEEVGAGFGLSWLCEAHPDAVRADYSLNEGGGECLSVGGRNVWLCATAEKMTAPFRLRVRGRSGHASMPGIADNALLKAAALVEQLGAYEPEPRLEPEVEGLLRAVAGKVPSDPRELVPFARSLDPLLGDLVRPLVALTLAPTMISASQKRNVIPALCEVVVDSRLLPGQTTKEQLELVRAVLGDGDYELESMEAQGGTRSPIDSSLWDVVESFVAEEDFGGVPAPVCVPGFTDSHWLRDAFGTVAYGFFPARMPVEVSALLIHSTNERVPVDDLELGVRFLRHAVRALDA
jgi:acetylornithine deacetylase/succinyl-diaminopimelate desuccinylase-like protein